MSLVALLGFGFGYSAPWYLATQRHWLASEDSNLVRTRYVGVRVALRPTPQSVRLRTASAVLSPRWLVWPVTGARRPRRGVLSGYAAPRPGCGRVQVSPLDLFILQHPGKVCQGITEGCC